MPAERFGVCSRTSNRFGSGWQKLLPMRRRLDPADFRRVDDIQTELQEVNATQIYPVWVKYGLHSIEGLEIDEKEATPEDISDAPPELYQEVLSKIQSMM